MTERNHITTIAAIIGVIYLFISLNPFILWMVWPGYINFPLFFSVVVVTVVLSRLNLLSMSLNKAFFIISIFLFMVHTGTTIIGGAEFNIGKLMSFTGAICILLFKPFLHLLIFEKFHKMMLFFSWFAVGVFAFTLIGIDLPYYKLEGHTLVMERSYGGESFYKLYGLVVSSTNTVYEFGGLTIARICGPFQEPGHFAIYVGVVMLFEKMIYNKFSKGFVIAGILTFSPNFFVFFVIIFLYDLIYNKNKKAVLLYATGFMVFISFLLILSSEIRDQLFHLTIGRNFGESSLNVGSVLDDRAGKQTLAYYESFINSQYFLYGRGVDFMAQLGVLSDWRGMVLKYGLIGLLLSVIACIRILFFAKQPGMVLIIGLVILLIYLQRAWMFESSFIYLFLIIGLNSFYYSKKIHNEVSFNGKK